MGGWRGWFSETFLEVQLPHTSGAATCGPVARHAVLTAFVFIVERLCSTVGSEGVELVRLSALRGCSAVALVTPIRTHKTASAPPANVPDKDTRCAHTRSVRPPCAPEPSEHSNHLTMPHKASQTFAESASQSAAASATLEWHYAASTASFLAILRCAGSYIHTTRCTYACSSQTTRFSTNCRLCRSASGNPYTDSGIRLRIQERVKIKQGAGGVLPW